VEEWRKNLAILESNNYAGSQNWSGYDQRANFLGLLQKTAAYHHHHHPNGANISSTM
jgi:hypothetical protein